MPHLNVKLLRLTGKTVKSRRFLSEAKAPIWRIVEEKDSIGFSNRPGPWARIRPNRDTDVEDFYRWVCLGPEGDKEFVCSEEK
jgi:hypothetical protein